MTCSRDCMATLKWSDAAPPGRLDGARPLDELAACWLALRPSTRATLHIGAVKLALANPSGLFSVYLARSS